MRFTPARYTQSFTQPRVIAAETLLLPMLMVALGLWLNPLDPLWLKSSFPWLWLAPLILALRYGPLPGIGGSAVLLVAWFAFQARGWVAPEFPKLNFLGGLITIMLCGEFSSLWLARTRRAESMQHYLDRRLEQLTEQFYLLRLSHDRLEQDLIGRPLSLREAMAALRNLTLSAAPDSVGLAGAQPLIHLLAQYCQLESAALYARLPNGEIDPQPAARLGATFDLAAHDGLVRYAIDNKSLAHVQTELPPSAGDSRYLVVAPLRADEALLGLLVVKQAPFFALHQDMLQTLNLMLSYYADGLMARETIGPLLMQVSCPPEFALELIRLGHIHRDSGIGSVLVALEFHRQPGYEDLPEQTLRQQRSLDVTWLLPTDEGAVLMTLMPLATESTADGYLTRIERWVEGIRGDGLTAAGVLPHIHSVDATPPLALIQQLMSACHVRDQAWLIRTAA